MPEPAAAEAYDALVLAGGAGRRLGGVDKAAVVVGGTTLLERVLAAVADASRVVVVGPSRPVSRDVVWTREHPAGGGPVAALAAGLVQVRSEWVALLAADLPFLDAGTVAALRGALARDGALLVDGDGRDQLLAGVWRTAALRTALAGREVDGARLGSVLGGLDAVRVLREPAPGRPAAWLDCDTPQDVRAARRSAARA